MTTTEELEARLRQALQAVAELPAPAGTGGPITSGHRGGSGPGGRRPWLVAAAVAAAAAVITLALVYGPGNGGGSGTHHLVPAGQSATTTPPAPVLPVTTLPPASTTSTTASPTARSETGPATTPGTEQITYQPFLGTEVNPALHVTSNQSGECFQLGGGADDRYYYRCISTSGSIMQPCFAGSTGASVGTALACPTAADPTSNDIVLWTPTSISTVGYVPATTKTPFAMQLSNGVVCAFVSAAWSGLGPYSCGSEGTGTPADCRQPVATATYWTASCQDQLTATSPFEPVTVEKIWF